MIFMTDNGEVDVAYLDGYSIRDRLLEGVMIECRIKSSKIVCAFKPEDQNYVSDLNPTKLLAEAEDYANNYADIFVTATNQDAWIEE